MQEQQIIDAAINFAKRELGDTQFEGNGNAVKAIVDYFTEGAKFVLNHPDREEGLIEQEAMHSWFGLSYASYLTVPRSLIQSMPDAWQTNLRNLLREMEERFDLSDLPDYKVNAIKDGKYTLILTGTTNAVAVSYNLKSKHAKTSPLYYLQTNPISAGEGLHQCKTNRLHRLGEETLWIEIAEDWHAFSNQEYRDKKVRVIFRSDWMQSKILHDGREL